MLLCAERIHQSFPHNKQSMTMSEEGLDTRNGCIKRWPYTLDIVRTLVPAIAAQTREAVVDAASLSLVARPNQHAMEQEDGI